VATVPTADGVINLYLGASLLNGKVQIGVEKYDPDETEAETLAAIATDIKEAINTYGDEMSSGNLTVGQPYEITAQSDLDFTADGAADSNVGTIFWAIHATLTLTASDKVRPISNNLALFASVATATPTKVDLTAKHKGSLGNNIDIRFNYYGTQAGESHPAGISYTVADMSGGIGDPDISEALAAIGTRKYFSIACPFADTSNLNLLQADFDDRWGPTEQHYGHSWSVKDGTVAESGTFGNGRNDPAVTAFVADKFPTPPEEILAAATAKAVASLEIDPALPLHTLNLSYILPPDIDDRWDGVMENTLLYDGVSPLTYNGDMVQLGRCITTYQFNDTGIADDSYLDVTTRYTLQAVTEFQRAWIMSKYSRHKLVPNGTPIPDGHAAVTPNTIKGEMIASYMFLQDDLVIVSNLAEYMATLTVEINALDPKRLDIEALPVLASQLDVIALKQKFLLSFKKAA